MWKLNDWYVYCNSTIVPTALFCFLMALEFFLCPLLFLTCLYISVLPHSYDYFEYITFKLQLKSIYRFIKWLFIQYYYYYALTWNKTIKQKQEHKTLHYKSHINKSIIRKTELLLFRIMIMMSIFSTINDRTRLLSKMHTCLSSILLKAGATFKQMLY